MAPSITRRLTRRAWPRWLHLAGGPLVSHSFLCSYQQHRSSEVLRSDWMSQEEKAQCQAGILAIVGHGHNRHPRSSFAGLITQGLLTFFSINISKEQKRCCFQCAHHFLSVRFLVSNLNSCNNLQTINFSMVPLINTQ